MNNSSFNTNISDQTLQQHLDKLSNELTPERDLWAGIERAINHAEQTTRQSSKQLNTQGKLTANRFTAPFAWAASVVVAVLLSWQLNHTFSPSPTSVTQQSNYDAVSFIKDNFQQQKQSLLVSYGKPESKQLPIKMQKELQQLESAQSTIYKALASDKNNQDLLNLLQWTQQQELKLLEQLYRPRWQTI